MSWGWVGHLMFLECMGGSRGGTVTLTRGLWGFDELMACWDLVGTLSSADSKQWVGQVRVQCLPLTPCRAKFKAWPTEGWLSFCASLSRRWATGREDGFLLLCSLLISGRLELALLKTTVSLLRLRLNCFRFITLQLIFLVPELVGVPGIISAFC